MLKAHPDIADAVVVGVPDPQWGQRVSAVIEAVRTPPRPASRQCRRTAARRSPVTRCRVHSPSSTRSNDRRPERRTIDGQPRWCRRNDDESRTSSTEVGYAVVPDVLTADEIQTVRDALAPHLERGPRGRNPFEGYETQRVYCLVAKSRGFDRLILDPLILEVTERALGPNFLLTATLAIDLHPGESAQDFHWDDIFYKIPRPRPAGLDQHVVGDRRLHRGQRRHAHLSGQSSVGRSASGGAPRSRRRRDAGRVGADLRRDTRPRGWRQHVGRVPVGGVDPVLRGVGAPAGELHDGARHRWRARPCTATARTHRLQHPSAVHGDDRRPASAQDPALDLVDTESSPSRRHRCHFGARQ